MNRFLFFLAFLLSAVTMYAQQEAPDPQEAFKQIGIIKGGWYQGTDQGDIVEEWKEEGDNMLVGRNFRVKIMDGDTASERNFSIKLTPDGMFYTARFRAINNNEPLDFKLIYVEDFVGLRTFVFENAKFEYPQKITYSIEANRNMSVKYEGTRNGKARVDETAYEREFSAAEKEMHVRFGLGGFGMKTSGFFFADPDQQEPSYSWRPGWELGAQMVFKGRGNYVRFGLEFGLSGRYSYVDTASLYNVTGDTAFYIRDGVRYNQSSVFLALTPELRLDKNDRITIFVGPYVAKTLLTRAKGGIKPDPKEKSNYTAINDLKKSDFGLVGGFNIKLNPWERDLGGRLGIRAWLGMSNLDNLYTLGCTQCTGEIKQRGFSVSYSVNVMK